MTTTTAPVDGASSSAERQARLAAAVRRLRTRSRTGALDRWLLYVGGTLLPLGLLAILLGWYGTANKPELYSQLSYLVSGGLLGLGLVITGGFVYFAYWLTLLVREGRQQSARTADALERLERLLAAGIVTTSHEAVDARPSDNGAVTLVATPSGTMLHRPDCPVVANRNELRTVEAGTPGFTPCKICDPLAVPSA